MNKYDTAYEEIFNEISKNNSNFDILEVWHAYVIDLEEQTVYVRIYDSSNKEDFEELDAEIDIKHFKEKISSGSYFCLFIGEDKITKEPINIIEPIYMYWTKEEIEKAEMKGAELAKYFENSYDRTKTLEINL